MKGFKWLITGAILLMIGIVCVHYIIKNEQQRKYPIERYLEQKDEKQQETEQADLLQTDSDAGNRKNHIFSVEPFTYEIISYEMIEDTEIENQTRYFAEYFYDGKLPDSDEKSELYDMDRLFEEHPEYHDLVLNMYQYSHEEYLQLFAKYTKGWIFSDYYIGEGHDKTYYYFIKIKVTNHSDQVRDLCLGELWLVRTNEKKSFADRTSTVIYFDKPQNTEGEQRIHRFCWYTMQPNETLECIVGYRMHGGDDYAHPENWRMHIGIISLEMSNSWVNPVLSETVVPLYDLPQMGRNKQFK